MADAGFADTGADTGAAEAGFADAGVDAGVDAGDAGVDTGVDDAGAGAIDAGRGARGMDASLTVTAASSCFVSRSQRGVVTWRSPDEAPSVGAGRGAGSVSRIPSGRMSSDLGRGPGTE